MEIEPRNIKVSAKYVAMIAPFISKEATRYHLGGIHIMPHPKGGVLMTATDGHTLAINPRRVYRPR